MLQNIIGYLASSQTRHHLFVKVGILSNVNLRPRTDLTIQNIYVDFR